MIGSEDHDIVRRALAGIPEPLVRQRFYREGAPVSDGRVYLQCAFALSSVSGSSVSGRMKRCTWELLDVPDVAYPVYENHVRVAHKDRP